ncbi:MAG: universal stress protein [Anaerolineae bacterium]|nr:universal stress protein [Gloeobacterales cyanobacterium ES-bin-313]
MHRQQEDGRPDPERLLRELMQFSRGRHKIFLSYAPGSGKTYRMLSEAKQLSRKGVDLVIGWVETHDRRETEALLAGLTVIAPRQINYQGIQVAEMDFEAILERQPATVLIDELAHTNISGSRHTYRYEDVEALLVAGISVISAMNIQHLESVAETAARIIGAPVRERVPDWILQQADEVQLIDASPETILERLKEGKVNTAQTAGSFFRRSTLVYLRELALRTVAQKVDRAILNGQPGVAGPAGVRERLMVAVSTNPVSKRLISRGANTAKILDAEFFVVFVRTSGSLQSDVIETYNQLTEASDGNFIVLESQNVAESLIHFALEKSITQVIVGESMRSPLEELMHGSIVNKLLRATSNLDVLIVGETESAERSGFLPVEQVTSFGACLIPQGEERRSRGCGRHKIYLGAAPGVGKTFAMLTEAHDLKEAGVDVVCGIIETHGRLETAALMDGLEMIPKQQIVYQGRSFEELDREAVIARQPKIVLVDELAHTNIPTSGHAKRYQDVEALLVAGIDVISTLNVQHIESLNTLVERTTGVKVRETVPDIVLECADEVILIDLPAVELCQRMREGKIYDKAKIDQALSNFFRQENLSALRELALREVADDFTTRTLEATSPSECILVCINLRPNAQQLIRRGARIAKRLGARLLVATISAKLDANPSPELQKYQRLTAELGGIFVERFSSNPAEAIVSLATEQKATLLILGQSTQSLWIEALRGSVIEQVLRRTRNLDTLIVGNFDKV